MPEILYKSKNFIVINKPAGVPSQKDQSGDPDAMTLTSSALCDIGEPSELFLIHRLDRPVGGALVFARNKHAAAEISAILTTEKFKKHYYAVIEGNAEGGILTDYIYKDAVRSKAFVKPRASGNAKYAELSYTPLANDKVHTLVSVSLRTGRFHQIRVQFSSRSMPLVGDGKYGSRDSKAHAPALFACGLEFSCLGERIKVSILPDTDKYPWSEFSKDSYKI